MRSEAEGEELTRETEGEEPEGHTLGESEKGASEKAAVATGVNAVEKSVTLRTGERPLRD